jgi:tetratricopeptide (TPR) repeat protein
VLAALLALVGSPSAPRSDAGDANLAKFLLDAGKKALEKKQYDDALVKLQRAVAEDATLAEAHYWIGVVQEKKNDVKAAVAAYRAFRDACGQLDGAGTLSAAATTLLKKAAARLSTLAAAETELAKLNADFADRAIAYGKTNFLRDPQLAERAAQAILVVQPDHDEARKLLERLGGTAPPAKPQDALYRGVKEWRDFIKTSFLGRNADWTYEDALLTIDRKGGHFTWPHVAFTSPKSFVFEIEARIMEEYPTKWCLGLAFDEGVRHQNCTAVHYSKSEVILWTLEDGNRASDLAKVTIEPLEPETWHRLLVSISGNRVQAYFDGKQVIEHELSEREDLVGGVGLFHQDCRSEIRVLRLGTRE